MPDLIELALHFDRHLGELIAAHGSVVYAMLFAIVFAEVAFLPLFFLPGDPLLFICGAYTATGALDLGVTMAVLFVAASVGSALNFVLGRAIGARLLRRRHRWLSEEALARTHAFFQRWGRLTFLVSPFLAVIRTFAPFVAGVSGMPSPGFLGSAAAGAALWVAVLVPAGYWFGNIPVVHEHLTTLVLTGIALGTGSLLATTLWRRYGRAR